MSKPILQTTVPFQFIPAHHWQLSFGSFIQPVTKTKRRPIKTITKAKQPKKKLTEPHERFSLKTTAHRSPASQSAKTPPSHRTILLSFPPCGMAQFGIMETRSSCNSSKPKWRRWWRWRQQRRQPISLLSAHSCNQNRLQQAVIGCLLALRWLFDWLGWLHGCLAGDGCGTEIF